MSRFNEDVYSLFTGWSAVITIVLSVYTGYLLWSFTYSLVYLGDGGMLVNKPSRKKNAIYAARATKEIREIVLGRLSQPIFKSDSSGSDSTPAKEEKIIGTVLLNNGKIVEVSLDELADFLDNNSDIVVPRYHPGMRKRKIQ